jgi:hypothetical protein
MAKCIFESARPIKMNTTLTKLLVFVSCVVIGISGTAPNCSSGYAVQDKCVPNGISPLDFWVNHYDDGHYKYEHEPLQVLPFPNSTAFVLNMTSQRWMLDDVFKPISPVQSLWHHQVVVIIPHILKKGSSKTGWLWITGGSNKPFGTFSPISTDPSSSSRSELAFSAQIAVETGTVAVVLKQVVLCKLALCGNLCIVRN